MFYVLSSLYILGIRFLSGKELVKTYPRMKTGTKIVLIVTEAILPTSVKASCQAQSNHARVYRYMSWPADTWDNKKRGASQARGMGLNFLLILEKGTRRNRESLRWIQLSNVHCLCWLMTLFSKKL